MRFKEFMLQQEYIYGPGATYNAGDGRGITARDYYPELRPFDQKDPGKMGINMMREELETLKKLRKLAMNIFEAIQLGKPDKQRYEDAFIRGSATDGTIYYITLHDIQRGEGGRQFLTSEEIAWSLNLGIFEKSGKLDKSGEEMYNLNLGKLHSLLEKAQRTIDQMGTGYQTLGRGWDFVAKGAYQGHFKGTRPGDSDLLGH